MNANKMFKQRGDYRTSLDVPSFCSALICLGEGFFTAAIFLKMVTSLPTRLIVNVTPNVEEERRELLVKTSNKWHTVWRYGTP